MQTGHLTVKLLNCRLQGFEAGAGKRSAEMGGFDGGSKRVKSDSET